VKSASRVRDHIRSQLVAVNFLHINHCSPCPILAPSCRQHSQWAWNVNFVARTNGRSRRRTCRQASLRRHWLMSVTRKRPKGGAAPCRTRHEHHPHTTFSNQVGDRVQLENAWKKRLTGAASHFPQRIRVYGFFFVRIIILTVATSTCRIITSANN